MQSSRLYRKRDGNRKHRNIFYLHGPFFARATFHKAFRSFSVFFMFCYVLSSSSYFSLFFACKVCWNSALSVQTTGPIGAGAYELNRPFSQRQTLYVTLKDKISVACSRIIIGIEIICAKLQPCAIVKIGQSRLDKHSIGMTGFDMLPL